MNDGKAPDEPRRPLNLIWLPKGTGALTTMCRGAILTVEQRGGGSQCAWAVSVKGNVVSVGVSPSLDHAQTAASTAAVEATAAR